MSCFQKAKRQRAEKTRAERSAVASTVVTSGNDEVRIQGMNGLLDREVAWRHKEKMALDIGCLNKQCSYSRYLPVGLKTC